MRIHALTVTAFGPFPERVHVDFEELNDAGIFLVTGDTGAGKSSLLDAICFALYGQIPGLRDTRSLPSHHARPEVRPEVCLEITLQGRRLRITRSPRWERPKRYGSGTTLEQARASLVEVVDGSDVFVSARAQEVGHELSELLPLSASQFQQVALLPQGQFQTFLHARTEDRRTMLQDLFHTERFARIEDWLAERSSTLLAAAAHEERAVRRAIDTIAHRSTNDDSSLAVLDDFSPHEPEVDDRILTWARHHLSLADELSHANRAEAARTAAEQLDAEQTLERAQRQHAKAAQLVDARAALARADSHETLRQRELHAAHLRALACSPSLALVDEAESARARTAAAVAAFPSSSARDRAEVETLTREVLRLEELVRREDELVDLSNEEADLTTALRDAEATTQEVDAALAQLPGELQIAEAELLLHRSTAATLEETEARLARAGAAVEASEALTGVQQRRAAAQEHHQQILGQLLDARAHALDVRERRLAGMAAELAGQLVAGDSCQVCGSTEHPRPAASAPDAVSPDAQATADSEVRALEPVAEAADQHLAALSEEIARLTAILAGRDAALVAADLREAESAVASARASADAVLDSERRVSDLRLRIASATDRRRDAEAHLVQIRGDLALVTSRARQLEAEIGPARGGHATVAAALADAGRRLTEITAALESDERHQAAVAELERMTERALTAALESGFDDLQTARAALLTSADADAIRVALEEVDRGVIIARQILVDLGELEPGDLPDVEAAAQLAETARAAAAEAAQHHAIAADRLTTLGSLVGQLQEALDRWKPLRERWSVAARLAELARAQTPDNQLQMRLSSYVVAARLDQVLERANNRLHDMRERRYRLIRTEEASRKRSQAGLDLRVMDDWTGEVREATSLSGGETFVVSLALALGLSDVVCEEAGGIELATLFVDEGFGMLDPDTLDDVMDRLDALRAGGRTVGVVSHVPELRDRIPTQLHVVKQRTGSTAGVTTLVG